MLTVAGYAIRRARLRSMVHDGSFDISRRLALRMLSAAALAFAMPVSLALADDGKGGGHGGGDGGGDGKGDGGGNNGNGGNGNNGNDNSDGNSSNGTSSDHALQAVQSGAAAPLRDILSVVKRNFDGQVVRVKLVKQGDKL